MLPIATHHQGMRRKGARLGATNTYRNRVMIKSCLRVEILCAHLQAERMRSADLVLYEAGRYLAIRK